MRLGRLLPTTVKGRDRLRAGAILGAAALAGYLLTCVAYPAPLMTRENAVERVLGLPIAEAERELGNQGLRPKREAEEADPVIPAGHVLWQDPPPGTALPRGTVVRLTVSSGPAPVVVPDVNGFETEQARQVVEAAGLRVGEIDEVPNAADAGVVVSTRPPAGATRPPGSGVGLIVSRGPADVRVPDLVGLEQDEARRRIENAGLRVGRVTNRSGRGKPGVVLQQRPNPGVLTPHTTRIDLVISN